jgi:hypothetical protein
VTAADCSTGERARHRTASAQEGGRTAVLPWADRTDLARWNDRTGSARWDDRTAFAQWDDEAKRQLLEILSEQVWDIEEELARVKEARARLMTSLQGSAAHRTG